MLKSESETNYTELKRSQDMLKSESETNYTELKRSQDMLKSESETNYTELKSSQDMLKSESETNYTELKRSQDMLKSESETNYTELKSSQDMLKSESETNYSNLQQSHDSLQSQYVTLNEKLDEVTKEFSVLKEIYCDGTNTSPDNTCSLCKPGWVPFRSKCYFISTNILTWKASRDWCETRRGRLVNIETLEEQDFIKRKAQGNFWIGRYNISKENNYQDGR
ncbi:low affinity immunoglobulin epsilon Fc receptor-like [Polypterus senegalus]|uniref:low affinity immunoglobulin epsilon Fc receptor-like n=1 Tax=Polypterus senegalus TaxID=55291 RepID=UPI00196386BA|nr:low affinity immunoglobulin epsilon Fc receptor-like [Polypterus senegalus]